MQAIDSGYKKWGLVIFNSYCLFAVVYLNQDLSTQHNYYKQFFYKNVGNDFEMYFNAMYSISFFFMIFCNMYLGQICDKHGGAIVMFLGTLSAFIGQLFTFVSLRYDMIIFLFLGRFGLMLSVTVVLMGSSRLFQKHFDKNQQSFINGISLMFSDLGIFTNMQLAIELTKSTNLLTSSFIYFIFVLIGLLFAVLSMMFDKQFSKQIEIQTCNEIESKQNNNSEQVQESNWSNFKQSTGFWYFTVGVVCLNIVSTVFCIILPSYLNQQFGYSPQKAGQISSILPLLIVTLPLISKIIDIYQHHVYWMAPCGIMGAVAISFLVQGIFPIFSIIIFGLQYNLRWGALFPAIQNIAKEGTESKCFALIRCFRDIGAVVTTFLNGVLYDYYNSYSESLVFLALLQIIAFFTILYSIKIVQKQQHNQQNMEKQQLIK